MLNNKELFLRCSLCSISFTLQGNQLFVDKPVQPFIWKLYVSMLDKGAIFDDAALREIGPCAFSVVLEAECTAEEMPSLQSSSLP